MTIDDRSWDEAVGALRGAKNVALACHLGPDGDALGSLLALTLALRSAAVQTSSSWGSDPFVVPKHYAFLPGLETLVPPSDFPPKPDVMVTFDCGSFERLGSLEPAGRAASCLIVVDHHATNDRFGRINLVQPDAAASAEIVHELIGRLGIVLDRDMATCIYTGLVTDTGAFKYRATSPKVLRIAAELLEHGIAHDEIVRRVYDTHPVGYLKLAGVALGRAELVHKAGLIWSWITQEDLRTYGLDMEDTEGLIDEIRTADVAEVACVLKEMPDGQYKVSLRSKGEVDVGSLSESLGGGGHRFAAGYSTEDGDPRRAVEELASRLVAT
jgi:bifunctional oligoribonuclease and PAP phosphatase NrnA